MKRTFLLIACLCFPLFASGTKYYVSSSLGSDATGRDGKSEAAAWSTLAKIYTISLQPGDSILLKRGDIWRETLNVPASGVADAYIYFGGYGSGPNPKIYGSELSATWTDQGGNIWKSDKTFTNPRANIADIHFIESGVVKWSNYRDSISSLKSTYDWTWSNNNIYVYSTSNPATAFSSIEIPQRYSSIDTHHMQYLHFDGIDVYFSAYIGYDDYTSHADNIAIKGLIIENCEVAYTGGTTGFQAGYGIAVVYSDLIIRNCTIHDNGRRGISLDIYGNGFTAKNAIIEGNTIYGGFHTTGVDLSVGNGYTGSWDGVYIRNNMITDVATAPYVYPSNQIFLQNWAWSSQAAKAENIYIYNNIFKYPNAAAINMEGMNNIFVYNNVFYEGSNIPGGTTVQLWIDAHNTNIKAKNNIFYSTSPTNFIGLPVYCLSDAQYVDLDYNLYYRISNSLIVIRYSSDYFMNTITTSLRSTIGWESHCPNPGDPGFISATDYHLLDSTSPAIGKGIQVLINDTVLTRDRDGKFYKNPPSIGAYEYNPGSKPPPTDTTGSNGSVIVLFPNPTASTLTVRREGGAQLNAQNLRIIDASGEVVMSDTLDVGLKEKEFNLTLKPGIYVVQVMTGNNTVNAKKLIIIRK